jgi:hypothetical protein
MLVIRFVRTGGIAMLRIMGGSPDAAAEHSHLSHRSAESSEAPPRTAKSVGTPKGPCGFLSASSRRDSRSGVADRRHPLRRIGRPKPQSPSLCHPSWLVRRSKRLCGSGREEHYALLRTWLKCQSLRVQGALVQTASTAQTTSTAVVSLDGGSRPCSPEESRFSFSCAGGGSTRVVHE